MTDGGSQLTRRQKRIAFITATAVAALTVLDLSKINVALPSIEESISATSTDLQLIVAGYVLVLGIVLVPAGRLGDLTSRRRLFLIGLIGFVITSVICATAPNPAWLLAGRLLQGVTAGIITPQVIGLIQELFQGRTRALAFGYFGGAIGIATTAGPVIGGALLALDGPIDGWRWLFWMNVPLAFIVIPIAMATLPRATPRPRRRLDLDGIGALLLGLTVVFVMLPFIVPQDWPATKWLFLLGAAAIGAGFVAWERRVVARGGAPLLQLALFQIPSYRFGLGVGFTSFAAVGALMLVVTLYLQQGLGYSPLVAGLLTATFAAGSAISSWFAGRLVFRLGGRAVLLGVAMLLVGDLGLLVVDLFAPRSATPWAIAFGLAIMGAGGGINVAANQTLMLSKVPISTAGVAASVSQVMQRIGTTIGLSAVTGVYFAVLSGSSGGRAQHDEAYRVALWIVVALTAISVVIAAFDRTRIPAGDGRAIPVAPSSPDIGRIVD